MNKWKTFLGGLLLAAIVLAGCGQQDAAAPPSNSQKGGVAGQDIDRTLAADDDGEVLVSNIAGSVLIHGWDKKEVRVTGELGKGTRELVFERNGSHVEIRVEIEKGKHRRVHGTDLEIWLPQNSEIKVITVSADIEVEGVHGDQRLQSVSGTVDTLIWENDLEVRSISGDVNVVGHGHAGMVTVNLVSGDADIENVSGEIEVQSVSGDLDLELVDIVVARVRSTTGDMELSGKLAKGARVDVESINGDAIIMLVGPVNAEIEIETFNGDIDNCFGPQAQRTSKYGPGRELKFTAGDGNGEIRIKTLNGDVTLCKK